MTTLDERPAVAAEGIGMVFGIWDYLRGPVTERQVDEELRRMR